MTDTPTDDKPGFVAEKPEHCRTCLPLIQAGETYYLTIDDAVLCPDCIRATDAIRLAGGLRVEVREDKLLLRRGDDVVEVLPEEVQHSVEALVEGRVQGQGRILASPIGGLTPATEGTRPASAAGTGSPLPGLS